MIKKIKRYFSENKVEAMILLLIIILAAFLRLYRIDDYMTFLGDEGRDVIIAKEILGGNLTLLGPRASAGDFFLGPIYYYLIAPFLLLSGYDPVGPAIMVALFGIATVYLVFYVGKKMFNVETGIIAASLYSVSPIVIAYSRSSWNPNLMPFVSLLIIYFIYLAVKNNSRKLFLLVGFLLGIAIQLHYLTVFLGTIVFFFVLIGRFIVEKKVTIYSFLKQYLIIFSGFLIGLSPFLLFEARHGFPNIRTIFKFIFDENSSSGYLPNQSFSSQVIDVFFRLFGRLVFRFPNPIEVNINNDPLLWWWFYGIIVVSILSVFALFKVKDKLKVLLFALYLFFGVILFGFYKKPIYDYYFGFMFPLPFILFANLLTTSKSFLKNKYTYIICWLILFLVLLFNLSGNPFRNLPNKQKEQARTIAEFVLSKTDGKPFNFALLAHGNSDHVYRYFFEIKNRKPVTIQNPDLDPERESVTDQLLIICEISDCQPLGNSLWEIAGFGSAEIEESWDVLHFKVFKLVPLESN